MHIHGARGEKTMEKILHHFFEFDSLEEVLPFGHGHINDTFKISLRQNNRSYTYLLQRFNDKVFKQPFAVMDNIGLVAEHLSKKNYPLFILKPFKTKKGELIYHDEKEGYWRVFNFFENTFSYNKVETPEQAFQAAKAYGTFAKALNDMDISQLKTTIPDFHNGEKRMANFLLATKNGLPERISATKKEIQFIFEQAYLFKKINNLKLSLRAVHHDTKINNILFDETTKKAVAVVDLDTVMPGTVLSDFGDMVRTFTSAFDEDEQDFSKVNMRPDIYHALTDGFISEMGDHLTAAEKKHLSDAGPWLTLMQAVRFLGDYLMGDIYYKTKYADHNLVRTRNQLALFRSMQDQLG